MSVEPNDPRLTAYALGELDADEAKDFEAELDDDARAEIEAIQHTAALLERELATEEGPGLDSDRRERIEAEMAKKPAPRPIPIRTKKSRGWIWAVAAALPVAFVLGSLTLSSTRQSEPMAAQRSEKSDEVALSELPSPPPMATAGTFAGDSRKSKGRADGDEGILGPGNAGGFAGLPENPFISVAKDPRSTFSVDVDTASYSIVRRLLTQGQLPPTDAVRIEEMINYFSYSYPEPKDGGVFTVSSEVSQAPWATTHRLVRIGIKGKEIAMANRPASNLVFLLDVSGSMNEPTKLPLLKRAFRLLVEQLGENDHVSIVV